MRGRAGRRLLVAAAVIAVLALVAAAVMFLPPFSVAERLAKPEFCASCHNMEPQYAAFRSSVHGELDSCNDCHLPNDGFVSHWFWDGVFGMRDLFAFHVLGQAPYDADATGISKRIIEANCVRCHAETVRHVDVSKRRCWHCHRQMYHRIQLQTEGKDVFGGEARQ